MFIKKTPPWNKDLSVGQRTPFTECEVNQLVKMFVASQQYRDLAILTLGVDSMLRLSDLRMLRVSDFQDKFNQPKDNFSKRQKKNKQGVTPVLTPLTKAYVSKWVEVSGKVPKDFLITSLRLGKASTALTESGIRTRIKAWAESLGLDPEGYSGHSLRRTKPIFMYQRGVRIEPLSKLLGHRNTDSTIRYIGVDLHEAQQLALEHDIFQASPTQRSGSTIGSENKRTLFSKGQLNQLKELFFDPVKDAKLVFNQGEIEQRQLAKCIVDELIERTKDAKPPLNITINIQS